MMKYVKMLGLAAIAAMAIMAVMGAGTASAKVCSKSGSGHGACAAGHGNVYVGNFTATSAAGTTATLVSGFVTVHCHSHVEGTINGTNTTGTVTSLTFSKCETSGGSACTAASSASAGSPWTASTKTGTAPNGTLTVNNVTGEFTCLGTTCKYKATTASAAVTGGETASVKATNVPLEKDTGSGFLCSNTATWSGTYSVSTPDSLYLT
jgi:hypothetical protein